MAFSLTADTPCYRNIWLICGVLYIVLIILGSLMKIPDISAGARHGDKLIHFLAYFILVGWFVQLYHTQGSRICILLFAIGLGLLLEWLQGMTGYRSFDWIDAVANSAGALSAYLLAGTAFSSLLLLFDHKLHRLIHPDGQTSEQQPP